MGLIKRVAVAVTTDGAGAATAYSDEVQGFVHEVTYVPHATVPLDTGADITITEEDTTKPILTWTNVGTVLATKAPRQATHSVAGAASLYAGGGTAVEDRIAVKGRIKVVVAAGVASKQGTFYFHICS